MSRTPRSAMVLIAAATWMASACIEHHETAWQELSPEERARMAAAPLPPDPGTLRSVPAEPVAGLADTTRRPFEVSVRTSEREAGHARRFGRTTLATSLRTRSISQYPCTSCHQGRTVTMRDERIEDAHRNIQPEHPREVGAHCAACHAPEDVGLLALRSGERAPLDHAYRLCAQCHFREVEAWAGGGHGKRLDGWDGRRVVMGCADCHDPHRPGVPIRVPFRGPTLEHPRAHEP